MVASSDLPGYDVRTCASLHCDDKVIAIAAFNFSACSFSTDDLQLVTGRCDYDVIPCWQTKRKSFQVLSVCVTRLNLLKAPNPDSVTSHKKIDVIDKKLRKKHSPAKRLARTFIHNFLQPSPFLFSFMQLPCMWLRLPCMRTLLRRYYDARELKLARRSLKNEFFYFRVRAVTFTEHHEIGQK